MLRIEWLTLKAAGTLEGLPLFSPHARNKTKMGQFSFMHTLLQFCLIEIVLYLPKLKLSLQYDTL